MLVLAITQIDHPSIRPNQRRVPIPTQKKTRIAPATDNSDNARETTIAEIFAKWVRGQKGHRNLVLLHRHLVVPMPELLWAV